MRADRLLRLLHLLQRHGGLPARRLAELLEVSERTVLRDMEALSAAGVPVFAERGRNGGCRLVEGWRTDATGLTTGEVEALFLWDGRETARELGLAGDLANALAKLAATTPPAALESAEALADVLVVDRRRWFAAAEEVPVLPVLRDAATRRRRVRLTYAGAGDEHATVRDVDPLGLVENAGRWYLLALPPGHDVDSGGAHTYRVSRVQAVDVLDEPAVRPADFDLETAWREARGVMEVGETLELEVAVNDDALALFRRLASFQVSRDTVPVDLGPAFGPAGRTRLRLTMRARKQALALVLTFAGEVELLGPPDLRAELVAGARAVLARHGQAEEGTGSRPDAPRS